MTNNTDGEYKLGPLYQQSKELFQSLKVVEYTGPVTDLTCYTTEHVRVEVQMYSLHYTQNSQDDEKQELPQAEILSLPHLRFANQWEELIFQDDIKGDLIWMMTNILKFSRLCEKGEINPLILLYGPPGTGKTTLCQGLAQKISIRLNSMYTHTRLVQIKTATLFSKYYSESARQVDEIFTKISRMCQDNLEEFICVFFDEVESIASSREFSTRSGESQDSLRATNALLTGLDRTKINPNIIFLCTSNMYEALDSAFLDRCGLKLSIKPPSIKCQYEILRSRIQNLMRRGVIETTQAADFIPNYDDAILASAAGHLKDPSCKLLEIVHLIRSGNSCAKSERMISGRSLTQLPEQAILRFLRSDRCDLNLALSLLRRFTLIEQQQKRKDMEMTEHIIETNEGKKRKIILLSDKKSETRDPEIERSIYQNP
ncbi:Pachytene checkpoint protein 2-like protein [Golovinomyces cichoracearum]|uniref:Pachytene checkpoint protein 2-like protein n=1 Tax=Golovinomyces cichoracearum TaxID=62708 RepID=A0A420J525_9PEZI|nr:Pachytene checkpoint protein 2-like protein [Golovinomyces cichoracearum]